MFACLSLFLLITRYGVSLSDWSGKYNSNPAHGAPWGDLECHRTWFTITTYLPTSQWYEDTQYSNKTYWPLDYPPLCAYWHSAVGSYFKKQMEILGPFPWYCTLDSKQGENEDEFIMFMRSIVVIGEFLVFAPALYFFLKTMFKDLSVKIRLILWFGIMMLPPALFIDHGHYQFNQIMHGFVLFAIAFVMRDNFILATVFMVFAVNFKQTALYFALPFVVYVISRLTIIYHNPNISTQV